MPAIATQLDTVLATQPQLSPAESAEYARVCARLARASRDKRHAESLGDQTKIAAADRAIARARQACSAIVDPHVSQRWAPDRIETRFEARWKDPSGSGVHIMICEMVLDHKDLSGPSYRTVKVILDEGGPPSNPRSAPTTMGVAWFAIAEQIQRGVITVLESNSRPGAST